MKVLLYADFRSPTARAWAAGLVGSGIEVHAVSSERVNDDYSVVQPSGAVSRLRQFAVRARDEAVTAPRGLNGKELRPDEGLQAGIALMRNRERRTELRRQVRISSPDLVHALRLPYEGVALLNAKLGLPLVVSTWGQDFVPQAENSRLLKYWLKRSLKRANGIQYDAPVDYLRALEFGLPRNVPELYAAGNFGIDTNLFPPSAERIPGHIVFPRGRAESANGAGFVRAVGLLKHHSQLTFTAIGLKGISYAEKAATDPLLRGRLKLTPRLSRIAFARVLGTADVMVSPTFTDGTPNSILESLACGVTVVAGNIPSIANLQTEVGVMTLFEHGSDENLAAAILGAVGRRPEVVRLPEHYSIHANQSRVRDFYAKAVSQYGQTRGVERPANQSWA